MQCGNAKPSCHCPIRISAYVLFVTTIFPCKLLVRNPLRAWNPHTALLRGGVGWEKEVECGEFDIVKLVMYVPIRPSSKFPH
jgi:hypothetical protein